MLSILLIILQLLLMLWFGGRTTMPNNLQTPPATQPASEKPACKLAFLDASKQTTRVINVETGAEEGTLPTVGIVSPAGGKSLVFIDMDGQKRLAIDQYVGLGRQYILEAVDGDVMRAAWSPDGEQIAVIMKKGNRQNLYVVNAAGDKITRLTDWDQVDDYPVWSNDESYPATLNFLSTLADGTTALYGLEANTTTVKRTATLTNLSSAPFTVFSNFGILIGSRAEPYALTTVKLSPMAPIANMKIDKPVLELVKSPNNSLAALSIGGDLFLIDVGGSGFRTVPGNPSGSQLAWLCGDIGTSSPRRR
jgi:hypothetical protein